MRDASANNLHGNPQGQPAAYARSTGSVVGDVGDTLFAAATPLIPAALFRNDLNVPVLKVQLWTGGDFITLDSLSVAATGSAPASSVNQLKFYLDNGDGAFSSVTDTALTVGGQSFSGGKATFSLLGAGTSQTLDASTKTYFLAWNMSVSADLGLNMGAMFARRRICPTGPSTGSPTAFPGVRRPPSSRRRPGRRRDVDGDLAQRLLDGVPGHVRRGNIDHFHWRWDSRRPPR